MFLSSLFTDGQKKKKNDINVVTIHTEMPYFVSYCVVYNGGVACGFSYCSCVIVLKNVFVI